ncbi:arginine/serine-rich coiled-coil protein 2-like isoform X2 [Paramacrobiotus metropolitanus]|uniref:arginine/serine-rich coiled-coil protein 2-like isoform X2 n=1 Tax=Paramacrobiotus metropolitanus TaxID=2943436 RepID=UPI002445A9D1|nr:arginine/serine-rich coiled-coil protein 2-like isoform X2 [Paramacrobiotus metropolitanus]
MMAGRLALVDYDNEEDSSSEVAQVSALKASKRQSEDWAKASRITTSKVTTTSPPLNNPRDRRSPDRRSETNRAFDCGPSDGDERRRERNLKTHDQERDRRSPRHCDRSSGRRESGGSSYDRHAYKSRSRSRSPERSQYSDRYRDYSKNRDNRHNGYREKERNSRGFEEKMKHMYPTKQLSHEELSKLPAYINPKNVNISKVIEQQEKRKLLWQGSKAKKEEPGVDGKAVMWQHATFSGDSDGAVATKFRKLMGLKTETGGTSERSGGNAVADSAPLPDAIRNQEELMLNLDRQYEVARLSAHTQRGIGLGFNSR